MTTERCPRCGGTRAKRKPAMAPGDNPFRYGPGVGHLPLCSHEFHEARHEQ